MLCPSSLDRSTPKQMMLKQLRLSTIELPPAMMVVCLGRNSSVFNASFLMEVSYQACKPNVKHKVTT